jgi:signal transduction histidine kinase
MKTRPGATPTRLMLIAGFGGLLLLTALTGLDAVRILRSIETRSSSIRNDFVERNRVLNRIRSDLYLSGTFVRDYVLEPNPALAQADLAKLSATRSDLARALQAYSRLPSPSESAPFRDLEAEVSEYWRVLEPVMKWDMERRRAAGYTFLRDEVNPRRTAMVATTDSLSAANEHALNSRIFQVTELFSGFRVRVGVTLIVALGLGLVLAVVTTRKTLAYESAGALHLAEMEQARSELKELSNRLLEVQESERRAISRELHDDVGQSLSAMLLALSNLTADMNDSARSALAGQVTGVRRLAESSLRSVRDMALLLRPSMLDDLGLVPALQWQGREVAKRSGLAVTVDACGVPEDLPDEYRTAIYRVVQEALHNCERHADATVVRVKLRVHAGVLILSVQDDGKGFDAEGGRGMGLLGMQERVTNLGGTFNVESDAGRGTLVMVRLALPV